MRAREEQILKEHCEIEERYFRIHDDYFPNYHKTPVTSKFYSKYDAKDLTQADEELIQSIKKHRDKGPKDKYPWPATENQTYGWFNTPYVNLDRDDERVYFYLPGSEITKHGLMLRADRSMKVEKFTGIPFKLQ